MTEFALHPRLAADTVPVADWTLSRVLLMNDARYPWLVLVPRRPGAVELFDLDARDRTLLIEEIARAGERLRCLDGVAKINVGALGNIVRQLHIHVVGRNAADASWPGPVWGSGEAVTYAQHALERRIRQILIEP
ncbi:MAG TPA: HIT family protein [Rhizomicrobium sp.]|jgi:diadenosine tetraphosphate (Ap4A) HIT family hydrolase|nr:HIT family protein [Rhizomicrobium sp.]